VITSCNLDEKKYKKEVTFDLNQRFALDAKYKQLEQRRNDPASFIAEGKNQELSSF